MSEGNIKEGEDEIFEDLHDSGQFSCAGMEAKKGWVIIKTNWQIEWEDRREDRHETTNRCQRDLQT